MSDKKLKLHLATSQKFLPVNDTTLVHLMLQIVQPKIEMEGERLPLNVCFVIDRSGSMAGAKLEYTKQAVSFAINHLESEDMVSVVIFDSEVELLIPATRAVNKDQLIARVGQLQPLSTTNLSGALIEGADQVRKNYSRDKVNRVVLLTDGLANEGVTDPLKLAGMVKDINSSGISVSTLGVGTDFDEDLLVDLAEAADGNFYFIASPDAIPAIFEKELQGLLNVTGQNPSLHIKPAKGTILRMVYGYEPLWGNGAYIKLPDIYNGETKTVIAELVVKTGKPEMMPIAGLHFRYHDVSAELSAVSYDLKLSLEVTDDQAKVGGGFDLQVKKEVELFKAGQAREDALKKADHYDYKMARKILYDQAKELNNLYSQTGDEELSMQAKKLEDEALQMDETLYSAASRKSAKEVSYMLRKKR